MPDTLRPASPTVEQLLRTSGLTPLDARVLACASLQWTRQQLVTRGLDSLDADQEHALQILFERRRQGEPVAYLTGLREFFGLDFIVTPDVLIPRPDTELLVELAQQFVTAHRQQVTDTPCRIADLGTGSGAIAVTLAHLCAGVQVTGIDVSQPALDIASRNAARHHPHSDSTLQLVHSDWFSALNAPDSTGHPSAQFDLIVSNPPYIEANDPHLGQGDLRFEPVNALTDHHDGLGAIRLIIRHSRPHLAKNGALMIEHGYQQSEQVQALLAEAGYRSVCSHADLAGILRVTEGRF